MTPGTNFMLRLRHALEWYAASRVAGEGSLASMDMGGESIGFGVDPSGFTLVDVIALASLGHVLGAGTCAGLSAIGAI